MSALIRSVWRMARTAALAIVCCAGAGAAEAASPGRIVVGAALNLSGAARAAGEEARNALLLEQARINRRGVAGGRMFLHTLDTGGSPKAAAAAVRKLARSRGAVAVIGPVEHYAAIASARAAQKERVPLFSLSAPEEILLPTLKWVFSTARRAALPVRLVLGHLKERGIRRAAVLGSSEGRGSEGREQMTALAPDFGVSILLNESFRPGEHNFLPFLERASMRSVGGFILWATGDSRLALARARLALDLETPLYVSHASPELFGPNTGGKAAQGVVFPASRLTAAHLLDKSHPAREELMAFRAAYRKKYRSAPGGTAAAAADALRLLAWAARGVGANRARIPAAMEETRNFQGLNGVYHFSKDDHNGLRLDSLVLVRVGKSGWELVRRKK